MPLDLTLSHLYRANGQEIMSMPGLLAQMPPRKCARARAQDRIVAYLQLTGNASVSSAEHVKLVADAVETFYQSTLSLTHALRAAAESINRALLERNMTSSGRGQYAVGWLVLAVVRDTQCTLLLSGPTHVYWLSHNAQHIHEPQLSGKGLGLSQAVVVHYSQIALQPQDRLLFCGKLPAAWDSALINAAPSSLSATRRRLTTITSEDLHAALIYINEGKGNLIPLNEISEPKAESVSQPVPASPPTSEPPRVEPAESPLKEEPVSPPPAHIVQPSAYALSPEPSTTPREFPTSIPRARPQEEPQPEPPAEERVPPVIEEETIEPEAPREPSERTRQAAKALVGGIRTVRKANERVGDGVQKFLPRLLPVAETESSFNSNAIMLIIAIIVPLIIATISMVAFLRFGQSAQYQAYLQKANEARNQAVGLVNPIERREKWKEVLYYADEAEKYDKTDEAKNLRKEANDNLDKLLGIMRLPFNRVFSDNLGIDISRIAATETDLFMLDAKTGKVLRAQLTNNGFQLDAAFDCKPDSYGDVKVGALVDILAMPGLNSINATLLGIDASGNLLYCAPGQVAQAIPLLPPDTNWNRVTGFTMDMGNLYVLDATARAVWVYIGRDGAFIDRPYFFFNKQTPEKQDVIDLLVASDELFMLHSDGHLSTCSYSRSESKPTSCVDPETLFNPFPALQDIDIFSSAHITQIAFSAPPDQSILLLSADDRTVFRLTPRSLELQTQLKPALDSSVPLPSGAVTAMAVSPNHVLYFAINGQIYFAAGLP